MVSRRRSPKESVALDPLELSVPVGSRVAHLFSDQSDRFRFSAFIAAGLLAHDKCIIVTDEDGKRVFATALSGLGLNVPSLEDDGALVFLTDQITVESIDDIGGKFFEDAKVRFRFMRCVNDSSWRCKQGWTPRDFLRLEVKGHLFSQNRPCTYLCQYDTGLIRREQLGQIMAAHQYTISGSRVEKNPDRRQLSQVIFDGMDAQLRALTHLQDLSLRLTATLSLDQTLEAVVDATMTVCGTDRAAISYVDETGELRIIKQRGLSDEYLRGRRLTSDDPWLREMMNSKQPGIIEDVDEKGTISTNYGMWKKEGIRSMVTLPLMREGEVFGVLGTGSGSPRRYSQTEVDSMAILAAQAGAALTNARLFDQLKEANRAKDEFLATLSHELRTPLTPILGWIRILARFAEKDPLLAQGFEVIERNARQQAELINDLLDLTRIISGKVELFREPTDLAHLIGSTISLVKPQADSKGITVNTRLGSESPACCVDPVRIQQIVLNLLSNAIKFTPEAGRVEVSLKLPAADAGGPDVPDDDLTIEVSDNGIGIEPEFLPHIFERFTQASSGLSRHFGGLGLGLAITRALVEMHGGAVAASSPGAGRGSRFTVTLPSSVLKDQPSPEPRSSPFWRAAPAGEMPSRQRPKSPARQSLAPIGVNGHTVIAEETGDVLGVVDGPSSDKGQAGGGSPLRLLVIEDSRDTLDMMRAWLTACGCEVYAAAGAVEGLALASRCQPDLIISDIGMPDVDGYQLLRELRKAAGLAATPAIALTGYVREEDLKRALDAGYNAHIAKPADLNELFNLVRKLAGTR
ncbi:MAG TPA: ATP-binding protein [Blastocatellia bacterium]|nr:ATP-binding protein [Blastocatellia bacterium]